ncbi:MAG: energy transducer TonB [Alloprevotella sp.]|nr:energy transducer TonB [Alloprevotella sp.]
MSKINLTAKDWCDLVFEGRNKDYGAYRMRALHGKRQLRAVVILLLALAGIVAFLLAKNAVAEMMSANLGDNEQVTEMRELKKEEPKKEEKKVEKPKEQEQPKVQEVQVRNTIQMVVPKIVDDDKVDHTKELKSQKELKDSKAAIGIQNIITGSDVGKFTEDLKEGQQASNRNTPPVAVEQKVEKMEVQDNNVVDVPASFPGGEAALRAFVGKNTVYPEIALEQGLQGTVTLRFKVDVDGSISAVTVKKSLSRECDKAAMDVVKKLPRFTPAKTNGRPVPVWFTLPVQFKIQ